MSETVLHYINGKKTSGSSTRKADVFNPALGEKTAEVVMGVAADVDAAVQAAKASFPAWANTPPVRRARVIFKFLELLSAIRKTGRCDTSEHARCSLMLREVERGMRCWNFHVVCCAVER